MVPLRNLFTLKAHGEPSMLIPGFCSTIIQDFMSVKVPILESKASLKSPASGPFIAYLYVGLLLALAFDARHSGPSIASFECNIYNCQTAPSNGQFLLLHVWGMESVLVELPQIGPPLVELLLAEFPLMQRLEEKAVQNRKEQKRFSFVVIFHGIVLHAAVLDQVIPMRRQSS
eukprot:10330773-Ditylum_brightwellii.AAC.1